jgi:energy-coupling factor transport system substrate-specific component
LENRYLIKPVPTVFIQILFEGEKNHGKEITQTTQQSEKKLRTKDLIYAGAFGAIYIVLMLIVVLGTSAIPVLYIIAPFTVGVVCATMYELCVLKVHKFGPALILGVLFALVACSGNVLGMALAVLAAVVAELIIMAGKYKSKKTVLYHFISERFMLAV